MDLSEIVLLHLWGKKNPNHLSFLLFLMYIPHSWNLYHSRNTNFTASISLAQYIHIPVLNKYILYFYFQGLFVCQDQLLS